MIKVLFENNIIAIITEKQFELHKTMQKEYNDIHNLRDSFAEKMRDKIKNSVIDITTECVNEYRDYCESLIPRIDLCMAYSFSSLLPALNVKIVDAIKVEKNIIGNNLSYVGIDEFGV